MHGETIKRKSVSWNLRVILWGILPNQTLIHGYVSLLSLHFVYNEGHPGHPQNACVTRFLLDLACYGSLSSCRHRTSVVLNLRSVSKFRFGVLLRFLLWGLVVWLGLSELKRSFLQPTSTLPLTFLSNILSSFPRFALVFSIHSLSLPFCPDQFTRYKNWPQSSYPVVFIVRWALGLLCPSELGGCLTILTHTLTYTHPHTYTHTHTHIHVVQHCVLA